MSMLLEPWMLFALAGALITGVAAPALGTYLVQRRLALIGDGIGHVALTGVAVGLLTAREPVFTAMVISAAGAIAIELVRARGKTSGDVALAILFYGGIAGGVFLVSLSASHTEANLMAYMFGSPLTTSPEDLRVMAVLGAVVLLVAVGLRPWLFAICHDEEHARVSGLRVWLFNLLLAVAAAVTVTVAMRAVGLLLVSALMVVPVATAQLLARGFRSTQHLAMVLGLAAAAGGVALSGMYDTATGATIVLLAIAGFAVTTVATGLWRWLRRGRLGRDRPSTDGADLEPPEVVLTR